MSASQIVSILLLFLTVANAEFTTDFRGWLDRTKGEDFRERMERIDMGTTTGSFGGRLRADERTRRRVDDDEGRDRVPVVFVHGVVLRASVFLPHKYYFQSRGYRSSQLFATTYADGGKTPMPQMSMRCRDVKQVRDFISAVHEYTNSTVDVVAYSMGVPISRKAILGGKCVETNEDLGAPLTDKINTFVGVAGVANGFETCNAGWNLCNNVNGFVCDSKYLENVNSPENPIRYEAQTVYSIYGRSDYLVGQDCCGRQCSSIINSNATFGLLYKDHGTALTTTMPLQYSLLRDSAENRFLVDF